MESFFTYSSLRKFIMAMKRTARVTSLAHWSGGNGIVLRHDVDVDIPAAHRIALLERQCGEDSTFFILTTTYLYNPMTRSNRRLICEIADLGFEIGLHLDPTVYGDVTVDVLEEKLDLEVKLLESIVERDVVSVSLHNPSAQGLFPLFDGYRNAYDPGIFSDEIYMTDSCMAFRGKDPFQFITKAEGTTIQIVLHPCHYSESGAQYPALIGSIISAFVDHVDSNFRLNGTYAAQIGDGTLRSCLREEDLA